MVRYLPIIVVLGLMIYCFIDVLSTRKHRFRSLGKFPWLLVTLIPVVGAILWLSFGRPRRMTRPAWQEQVIHVRRPERRVAPDDDPDFLRVLDERAWRAQREVQRHPAEPGESDSDPDPAGAAAAADPVVGDPEDPMAGGGAGPAGDTGDVPPQPRRGD